MSMKKSKHAKRKAEARKQKVRRLKLCDRDIRMRERSAEKSTKSISDMMKDFSKEVADLVKTKEQVRLAMQWRMRQIHELKEKDPEHWGDFDTSGFADIIGSLSDTDEKITNLAKIAAAADEATEVGDRVSIVMHHLNELLEAQTTFSEVYLKGKELDDKYQRKLHEINSAQAQTTTPNQDLDFSHVEEESSLKDTAEAAQTEQVEVVNPEVSRHQDQEIDLTAQEAANLIHEDEQLKSQQPQATN